MDAAEGIAYIARAMRLLLFLSALLAAISGSGTAARAADTPPPMAESVRTLAAPVVTVRRSVPLPMAADFASAPRDIAVPLTTLVLRPTPLYAEQRRE